MRKLIIDYLEPLENYNNLYLDWQYQDARISHRQFLMGLDDDELLHNLIETIKTIEDNAWKNIG